MHKAKIFIHYIDTVLFSGSALVISASDIHLIISTLVLSASGIYTALKIKRDFFDKK